MFERKEYLTWDDYFMTMAEITSLRSKDPSSQVGAVIVDKNNRVLSIGYNGAPNGFNDKDFPWERTGEELNTKYPYVCHAELNAISNYYGDKQRLEGAKIYVNLFPCNECTKLIIQNGIKEIIYSSDKYANTTGVIASKRMLDICNIKYRQLNIDMNLEIKNSITNQYITKKIRKK